MAEGSYEYECNRAELLGINPPNKADFEAAFKARQEDIEKEMSNEVETLDEQINNTSGKFDELNSILSVTQQRLTKFKTACGSLTNLLKIRGKTEIPENFQSTSSNEAESSNNDHQSNNIGVAVDNLESMKSEVHEIKESTNTMQQKMSSQFDKLDAMLNKAENAQYAMSHQNQQMKKFLK